MVEREALVDELASVGDVGLEGGESVVEVDLPCVVDDVGHRVLELLDKPSQRQLVNCTDG